MSQHENFRDNLYTVNDKNERVMVRPKKQTGKFYNWRNIFAYAYLFLFFTLPFIKVNGNPLLLLNIPERKFIIFSVAFFPQDFFLFGLAMITFVVFIILFTAIFGRLFCGWACPQTVFMEMIFRKIEYWLEGDAQQQRNLDKMSWSAPEKLKKRGAKYLIYLLVSFIISNYFLMYIISFDEWKKLVTEPPTQHLLGLVIMFLFTGVFFSVFMYLREIVCTVVCPYGRLQGVLLDQNSLVVAYDYVRGEPRGKLKKAAAKAETMIDLPVIQQGDCIACNLCVQVCPTGIDIRNGTQLECINCTLCIDACDEIMTKVSKPTGLIRYASEQNIKDKQPFTITRRIMAYSAVLVALVSFLSFQLATRTALETVILRAPGQLFQEQADNKISNLYTAKLFNKTHEPIFPTFRINDKQASIKIVGDKEWVVPKEGMLEIEFFILIPRAEIKDRKTNLTIEIFDEKKNEIIDFAETTFMGVPFK